jgi:DNA-binding NtrC family response regulator
VILAGKGAITTTHLPDRLGVTTPPPAPIAEPVVEAGKLSLSVGCSLREAEKALILATMEYTNQNRRRTAEILGLSLKTIQIKLKEYRSDPNSEPLAVAAGE